MKIKLAKVLGYCPGVRRAMDTAFARLAQRGGEVYSHGELIHNGPALELLAKKGLNLWQGEKKGAIIVRAHGLPPEELALLAASELSVSDATCPRVRLVQELVAREAAAGYQIIIWGKINHPEVVGILGYAGKQGQVVSDGSQVAQLPAADKVYLVSQTTQDISQWPEVVKAVQARWPEARIKNTICKATEIRQAEVRRLAGEVEVLVIIGGKTSGNTARLADIGHQVGLKTILVEKVEDLEQTDFSGVKSVGVAAGASTSIWQIAQILQALRALARSHSGFGNFWSRLLRALVLGNLWAALGLATLAWVVGLLLRQPPDSAVFSFFFFQVLALHLFRDIFHHKSRSQGLTMKVGDPDRTAFYAKYSLELKILLVISSLLAGLGATLVGYRAVSLLGLTWLVVLAYQFAPRPKVRASLARTLAAPVLLAGGWAVAMVWANLPTLPPELEAWSREAALFCLWTVLGHIFVLAILMDVLGVQGDRIFGRPTLPTVLGEKKTSHLLTVILLLWSLGLVAGATTAQLPSLAWLIIVSGPIYNFLLLKLIFADSTGHELSPSLHGYFFEALMYGQLCLAGLLAGIWSYL